MQNDIENKERLIMMEYRKEIEKINAMNFMETDQAWEQMKKELIK